jgi:hypothetical protein
VGVHDCRREREARVGAGDIPSFPPSFLSPVSETKKAVEDILEGSEAAFIGEKSFTGTKKSWLVRQRMTGMGHDT